MSVLFSSSHHLSVPILLASCLHYIVSSIQDLGWASSVTKNTAFHFTIITPKLLLHPNSWGHSRALWTLHEMTLMQTHTHTPPSSLFQIIHCKSVIYKKKKPTIFYTINTIVRTHQNSVTKIPLQKIPKIRDFFNSWNVSFFFPPKLILLSQRKRKKEGKKLVHL